MQAMTVFMEQPLYKSVLVKSKKKKEEKPDDGVPEISML